MLDDDVFDSVSSPPLLYPLIANAKIGLLTPEEGDDVSE